MTDAQKHSADRWQWWRNALKGSFTTITEDPESGYYRLRAGTGLLPIVYWYDEGRMRCLCGGMELDELSAKERWPFASKRPITREAYDFYKTNGRWPDESEAAHHDRSNSQAAPDPNSFEALSDRIEDLSREAEQIVGAGDAKTQEAADRAADLAQRLTKLETEADTRRKAEKKPWLEAIDVIDRKWMPLRDRAADLKKRLKRLVIDPFLAAKNAELQERRAAAIAQGKTEAVPQKPASAGTMGRKIGQRTEKRAEITDAKLLAAHLIENKNEVLADCLQLIANRAAKADIELPGIKIIAHRVAA